MKSRSTPVEIVTVLAVAALLLGGLAYATWRSITGPHCTAAEEDLLPTLAAQKILDVHPDGAVEQDSYANCFQDDPFPYAGKRYRFVGTREDHLSFYEAAARNDGWQLVTPEEPSDFVCYTKKLGDDTVFLSVSGNKIGGVSEYNIDIGTGYEFMC
ncbi:hypothetical protein HS041_07690 [Planomonospora sp. ID67723]|uniref:hypothetical protein n=1 Tax=Planomonospora sp. ID67723 TaxID=2738134 RepID=UPI0018C4463D|nr:hypothetical protein [Planomonospora sp. ID67723]MBG0827644.1 hypothetical protein [Planomonospora sp. ID67723]